MNPETDYQLTDRVIDPELSNDEFITSDEFVAYARHLSDRELVDTEANRATWIAARTYYDAEAVDAEAARNDAPAIVIDREAEQERRLHAIEEGLRIQAHVLDDLRFRPNEDRVKEMALSMAASNSAGEKASSIVEKAKAFEAFLNGKES